MGLALHLGAPPRAEAGLPSPQGLSQTATVLGSGCAAGQGGTTWGIFLKARRGDPSPIPYSGPLQNDADSSVSEQQTFLVVVAIDFGTTSSGYAYSFTKEPECIHVMRRVLGWAGAGAGSWTLAQLGPNSLCHSGQPLWSLGCRVVVRDSVGLF